MRRSSQKGRVTVLQQQRIAEVQPASRGGLFWLFLLGCAVMSVALLLVWQRLRVINLGYVLSSKTKLERQLEQENRELSLELATLTSPERLESVARKLDLREPTKGQVVVLP